MSEITDLKQDLPSLEWRKEIFIGSKQSSFALVDSRQRRQAEQKKQTEATRFPDRCQKICTVHNISHNSVKILVNPKHELFITHMLSRIAKANLDWLLTILAYKWEVTA